MIPADLVVSIFPIRPLLGSEYKPSNVSLLEWSILRRFINVCLSGLHFQYKSDLQHGVHPTHTAAQVLVCRNVVDRASLLLERLKGVDVSEASLSLPAWFRDPKASSVEARIPFNASFIDNLSTVGNVDPLDYVPNDVKDIVLDPSVMFANPPECIRHVPSFPSDERDQYVQHVVNLLLCGKVRLLASVKGGGEVFSVGKKDSTKQREVWNGKLVSSFAAFF